MRNRMFICFIILFLCVFAACESADREISAPQKESYSEDSAREDVISQNESTSSESPGTEESVPQKETLSPEEYQHLYEEHPQFFGLDTTDGIKVLMFGDGREDHWKIDLVPGSKESFSFTEGAYRSTFVKLTLEEAKKILLFYDLPDEKVFLQAYDDGLSSDIKMELTDELLQSMSEAFDSRYQVLEMWFKEQFDPESDASLVPGF